MVDTHFRLSRYIYAFLLTCLSALTHALEITDLETGHGGFAFNTVCSHPTNLSFCVAVEDGAEAACALYQPTLDPKYSYKFSGVVTLSNGVKRCEWVGKNPANNTPAYNSAQLTYKTGLCPAKEAPPPEIIKFGRQGRWFPQELESNRCYRSCEYSNAQSFDFRHILFTNGVITDFTEKSNARLRSNQKFCYMQSEPIRDSSGEVTYESNCDDATFKQICDFINWFRNDSEMPEAPPVENKSLQLELDGNSGANIDFDVSRHECNPVYETDLAFTIMNQQFVHKATFDAAQICSSLFSLGNFFRIMYLVIAAYIVFRD